MRYNAYEVTLFQYKNGGYSAHWRIRGPNTYYHHRVGGPAYGRYNSEGSVLVQTWDLEGVVYYWEAEYQKALEEWLG